MRPDPPKRCQKCVAKEEKQIFMSAGNQALPCRKCRLFNQSNSFRFRQHPYLYTLPKSSFKKKTVHSAYSKLTYSRERTAKPDYWTITLPFLSNTPLYKSSKQINFDTVAAPITDSSHISTILNDSFFLFLHNQTVKRLSLARTKLKISVEKASFPGDCHVPTALAVFKERKVVFFDLATQRFHVSVFQNSNRFKEICFNSNYDKFFGNLSQRTAPSEMKFVKGIVPFSDCSNQALVFDEKNNFSYLDIKFKIVKPILSKNLKFKAKEVIHQVLNIGNLNFIVTTRNKIYHMKLQFLNKKKPDPRKSNNNRESASNTHFSKRSPNPLDQKKIKLHFTKIMRFNESRDILLAFYEGFLFFCQRGDQNILVVHLSGIDRGNLPFSHSKVYKKAIESDKANGGNGITDQRFGIHHLLINENKSQLMLVKKLNIVEKIEQIQKSQQSKQSSGNDSESNQKFISTQTFVDMCTGNINPSSHNKNQLHPNLYTQAQLKSNLENSDPTNPHTHSKEFKETRHLITKLADLKLPSDPTQPSQTDSQPTQDYLETYREHYFASFYDILYFIPQSFLESYQQTPQQLNYSFGNNPLYKNLNSSDQALELAVLSIKRIMDTRKEISKNPNFLSLDDLYEAGIFDLQDRIYSDSIFISHFRPKSVFLLKEGKFVTFIDSSGNLKTFLWGVPYYNQFRKYLKIYKKY